MNLSTLDMISVTIGPTPAAPARPGLPQPGTLEHGITLSLFRLQQTFNLALMDMFGPEILAGQPEEGEVRPHFVKSDKIGTAAAAAPAEQKLGILDTVASLPGQITAAAFSIGKPS